MGSIKQNEASDARFPTMQISVGLPRKEDVSAEDAIADSIVQGYTEEL